MSFDMMKILNNRSEALTKSILRTKMLLCKRVIEFLRNNAKNSAVTYSVFFLSYRV